MSVTNTYKTSDQRFKVLTSENSFSSGMRYSDNPLAEGYVKTLINYQLANDGATLKPRAGYKTLKASTAVCQLPSTDSDACIYLTDQCYISLADETDAYLCRTTLFGAIRDSSAVEQKLGLPAQLFRLSEAKATLLYNGNYITGINKCSDNFTDVNTTDVWCLAMQPSPNSIHDVNIEVGHSRSGTYTIMDNNIYAPVYHIFTQNNMQKVEKFSGILRWKFSADMRSFTWWVAKLNAHDITAVQAVNYGYNMLATDPYHFTNQVTANQIILLDGILPYDANNKLLTSARAGAEIFFHLIYRYPQSDVDNNKKYYVQWEIQDLSTDGANSVVLQQVRESPTYTPGDDIYFRTTQTTYKQFTLIAKVYYKDVVDNTTYTDSTVTQAVNDSIKLEPIQVITLAYYYLTDDSSSSTLNIEAVKYDLSTAQGMCTWQQRVVLWGVRNAKNTLWVSEINDPSWFPYPNNCEIFADDIVACVKYKTSLLVFTKSALYQLTFQEDGLTYTTTCIQERLTLSEEDITSILPVQSMVFFKNGNYYYMIVPVSGSISGELQLAPITRPIEYILDNFKDESSAILDALIQPRAHGIECTYSLYDWWCALEQQTLRIFYKFKVIVDNTPYTFIDLVYNYDTKTRTWTMSEWNATAFRMQAFIPSVTAATVFVMPARASASLVNLNLIQADVTQSEDTFPLDYAADRFLGCVQYVDTGYRNINADMKKRFRQIQFRVTNPYSKHLDFYTEFRVDNDLRKALYTYTTTEITDKEAEDYGSIYVDAEMEEADSVDGMEDIKDYCNTWSIDPDRFPDMTTAQVKLNVSGKGRLPRLIIRSENITPYEITNLVWVYRTMWGR